MRQRLHLAQMSLANLKRTWTVSAKIYSPSADGFERQRRREEYPENRAVAWLATRDRLDQVIMELASLRDMAHDNAQALLREERDRGHVA